MKAFPMLVLAAAVPLFLSGCGAPTSIATNTYPDVPNGHAEGINLFSAEPIAVWDHGRTILAIVTVGSGSCPPVPTAISAKDASTIALTFVRSPNSPCSADLGPTTHEFKIPEGIDVDGEVTVELLFDFETDQTYTLTVQ
ncbi:MAG: hypothetical protein JWP85_2240 [Rhodoglobus sp.]|nr:hypothetical protein [Rhodoglobus sp.]